MLDRERKLRPVDLHSVEAEKLLDDVSPEVRFGSWHLVSAGDRTSAGEAFAPLLAEFSWGSVPSRALEKVPRLTARGYELVANRRSLLGRLVTDGADRRASAKLRERS